MNSSNSISSNENRSSRRRTGRRRLPPLAPGPSLQFVVANHPDQFRDGQTMRHIRSHVMYQHRESQQHRGISRSPGERSNRDNMYLQSETCGLKIPEIDLVLQAGTLGGRFTTLEGLLNQVYEELSDKVFASGDSVTEDRNTFEKFLADLKAVRHLF